MIKTDVQDDSQTGIKGFTAAYKLLLLGAKGANGFLTYIVDDPTIQVHVGFADLDGDVGANTEYMVKGGNQWHVIGPNLRGTYAALNGPASQVGSTIELNRRPGALTRGYLEVAQILAHELTLHAMAIETFRERILARDEELQNEWRDTVLPGGQLSQQNQHAAAAFNINANYEPLIDNMCAKLAENQAADQAKLLRKNYEDDILHLKVEYAKRELGPNYLQHHLLAGIKF